ncbi:lipoyl(octanoyl) transferase LipB [Candidatus Enterovibrio escicola]|uniref:Octanoyltransferase n=1 Tax=Candidatus Enterovibrio escicola TaxID=1927127 RepID=A0A2A5SZT1_9GAMM|nr:lipoyl(octanoyl) transferase LipB [Candidatus Enterovibrio escacola]PCS21396.1 Octanoate-[acyl-carrier-protein]-protein-N-octan oyltransferase [Candidatus Enterovibrio escacola]
MQRNSLIIRQLGLRKYQQTLQAMHTFTDTRQNKTFDEIWFVEHEAVFTQGQAGKTKHLLETGDIPVVQSDRGGQVTYHGPGQLVTYILIDLKRKRIGVREFISHIENTVIDTLVQFGIESNARPDAPGVYVGKDKICSLGFRIRRGYSFHGLAINVNMDLSPFLRINPCGYTDMTMTQTIDLGGPASLTDLCPVLVDKLIHHLNYDQV